jgi:peroxiredoxin Q/BCP
MVQTHQFAQKTTIKVGDQINHFNGITSNGEIWNSQNVLGKKNMVIYFYPAAMTGGCTKQACAYRDNKSTLDSLGTYIIGISGDSQKNLALFKDAYNLNFTLLSDEDATLAKLFGVPINKSEKSIIRNIGGIEHTLIRNVTTSRWTFVIDKNQKVIYKSTNVKAEEDSQTVIEMLTNIK